MEDNNNPCPVCQSPLVGKKTYCSDKCRIWAYHERKAREIAEECYKLLMCRYKRPPHGA